MGIQIDLLIISSSQLVIWDKGVGSVGNFESEVDDWLVIFVEEVVFFYHNLPICENDDHSLVVLGEIGVRDSYFIKLGAFNLLEVWGEV